MENRLWYAVLADADDTDWGCGSFDWDEAVTMAQRYGADARIAAIDGGYDENGNATTDPVCVAEYFAGEDF